MSQQSIRGVLGGVTCNCRSGCYTELMQKYLEARVKENTQGAPLRHRRRQLALIIAARLRQAVHAKDTGEV